MSEAVAVQPLEGIKSIDTMTAEEYNAWLNSEGVEVVAIQTGEWNLIEKSELVGTYFVIAKVTEQSEGYVTLNCYLRDGSKVVFNDGSSTGVKKQVLDYVAKTGRSTGIAVTKGLRVSEYEVPDPKNPDKMMSAKTYYLAGE